MLLVTVLSQTYFDQTHTSPVHYSIPYMYYLHSNGNRKVVWCATYTCKKTCEVNLLPQSGMSHGYEYCRNDDEFTSYYMQQTQEASCVEAMEVVRPR